MLKDADYCLPPIEQSYGVRLNYGIHSIRLNLGGGVEREDYFDAALEEIQDLKGKSEWPQFVREALGVFRRYGFVRID